MIGFLAVVIAIPCVGFAIVRLLSKWFEAEWLESSEPLEIASASILVGLSVWIAGSWSLALTGTLTRSALLAMTALFVAVGCVVLAKAFSFLREVEVPRAVAIPLLSAVPILVWTSFVGWRSSILPPLSHDALAYHLPKALMIARAHEFRYFEAPDLRISHLPANYELLLADVILLMRGDRLTEWVGIFTFISFLVASGALAQRWWSHSTAALATILVVGSAPVVLLHSAADKNDLLVGCFALSALLFGSRWAARGGTVSLLLLVMALTAGGGTKPQQAAVMLGLAPFLIRRAIRDIRIDRSKATRTLFAVALAAPLWFGVTGGAAYVANAIHESAPLTMEVGATAVDETSAMFQWGDFHNLWQFPLLLVLVVFSPNDLGVWVPWRHEYWFWPEFELYFSHFGILATICVLALPLAVGFFRRMGTRPDERFVQSIAVLLALVLTLPVQFRPIGAFASFPRYVIYALPLVVAWVVPPVIARVNLRTGGLILSLLSVHFVYNAVRVGTLDHFAPLAYVQWVARNPGTREIYISSNRAASVVDRVAAPDATIAVDGAFDTWLYPAFGRELRRNLILLPPAAPGRTVEVPAEADWVIVDRSWSSLWGHPELTDMGRFWKYRAKGRPRARDLAVLTQLLRDPRFVLVFRDFKRNQAVFARRRDDREIVIPRRVRFKTPASERDGGPELFWP